MELRSYVALTDQGPYLNVNEDAVNVNLKDGLYMILDGFGGAGSGDRAVEAILKDVNTFYTKIGDDPDATLPFYYNKKHLLEGNALINAVNLAHKNLLRENFPKEMGVRGGASGVFIAASENMLSILSIGNCKSFYIRENKLSTISIADSYENIAWENSANMSFPLTGIGLFDDITYSTIEFRPRKNDLVICLTEGAYFNILEKEIVDILGNQGLSLSERAKLLTDLANDKGNQKNQSLLLLQY